MKTRILSVALLGMTALATTSSCRDLSGVVEQCVAPVKTKTGIALIHSNTAQCVVAVAQKIKA